MADFAQFVMDWGYLIGIIVVFIGLLIFLKFKDLGIALIVIGVLALIGTYLMHDNVGNDTNCFAKEVERCLINIKDAYACAEQAQATCKKPE